MSNFETAIRRKRLLFRCWNRGTQESDLLLGRFADASVARLDASQLAQFEALLDCSDPDLFDWILGGCTPPPQHDHQLLCLLKSFWVDRAVIPHHDLLART
ncbi:MAG: succinate dehydrogenase assembly factor 2 [Sinobacteraceae bacterium]|nr:succinate dehydrogenase assembly factor 2 [Nevskiaceae bacterium]